MNKAIILLGKCAFVLTTTGLLAGCSLLSYISASNNDKGQPGTSISFPDGLINLPLKSEVFILRKDSSLIQGNFKGVHPIPDTIQYADYQDEFERWRAQIVHDSCNLPLFGAGVQIVMMNPRPSDVSLGRFAGFDPGCIRLIIGRHGEVARLDVKLVKEMHDSLRHVITSENILRAYHKGVPFAFGHLQYKNASLLLDGLPGIAFDDIEAVYLWEHTDARLRAFHVGLGLDLVLVTVAGIVALAYANGAFSPF